jgi:hypothetical protein
MLSITNPRHNSGEGPKPLPYLMLPDAIADESVDASIAEQERGPAGGRRRSRADSHVTDEGHVTITSRKRGDVIRTRAQEAPVMV